MNITINTGNECITVFPYECVMEKCPLDIACVETFLVEVPVEHQSVFCELFRSGKAFDIKREVYNAEKETKSIQYNKGYVASLSGVNFMIARIIMVREVSENGRR